MIEPSIAVAACLDRSIYIQKSSHSANLAEIDPRRPAAVDRLRAGTFAELKRWRSGGSARSRPSMPGRRLEIAS